MKARTVIPVILSGGSGTRLWPMSRPDTPKQFLNFLEGHHSLFQSTVLRALEVSGVPRSQLVVVTLAGLEQDTIAHLADLGPGLTNHIICEPESRNTAAALALAALYVRRNFGADALMWVMPSDGHIGDQEALKTVLEKAADVAKDGYLVTFGIHPRKPEVGFGYIAAGEQLGCDGVNAVAEFIEKPDAARAAELCRDGRYLWNSGMYVFQPQAVLAGYAVHAPATIKAAERAFWSGASGKHPPADLYSQLKEEPFEKAILEKADKIAVVPCDLGWSDVGTWESLWQISDKDKNGNAIVGRAVCRDMQNSIVHAQDGRLIACIGLQDVVVIDAGDVIMVADKNNSEAIKMIAKTLNNMERKAAKQAQPAKPVKIAAE